MTIILIVHIAPIPVIIRVVEVEADTIHIVHIAPTIRVPAALMVADTAVAVVIVVVLVKIPM